MFEIGQLHWDDIESPIIPGTEYLAHFTETKARIMHQSNYKAYTPDLEMIHILQQHFSSSSSSSSSSPSIPSSPISPRITILILGASWCKTCAHVTPLLTKIAEQIQSPNFEIFVLSGAKTTLNTTQGASDKIQWAKKSPPEYHNPKFDVVAIPIVYVFKDRDECIARVIKYPTEGLSYEAYLVQLLQP
ncbi:MAG: thioredoxin-like domain-containing protein [Promethearchaeota archaeon]